ncbi:hypothetical protein I4641_10995 [Waterburya agarophytonicola K14]|uniref:Uncharacterized protein n=1 Tax=Waterburya agarophytonicola KI4 TaxID=2874699 RepID=A0A964BQU1_9CYAN|nr:hypothetical protein [Waterburya agarophytonicola]MCC0177504.1 hypothetical protein [Waterburya agarophytonicola KI4]
MNVQILNSHSKQLVFALLAVSTIGLFSVPAKADDALIQESIQESVVTGSDNVSVQNSNQRNQQYTEYRDNHGRYGRDNYNYNDNGSTGIVQRSDQFCDQVGEYNTCVQDAQQSNNSHTRRERRSRSY